MTQQDTTLVQKRTEALRTLIESAPRTRTAHPPRGNDERPDHISPDVSGAEQAAGWQNLSDSARFINGVPLDFYDLFDTNLVGHSHREMRKLTYLTEWAVKNTKDLPEAITRLNQLAIKLGNWASGEAKLDKLYTWIKLNGNA